MRILLLNGPNLGRLGQRQPEIYGSTTLLHVVAAARDHAASLGHELSTLQSNHEGALIDRIEVRDYDAIVINPGALTHYAWSLHDALLGAECPVVEVHISDILAREAWRHVSVIEPVVSHRILGHGWRGYLEAIDFLHAQAGGVADERAGDPAGGRADAPADEHADP
jgi:3-dehydroquinate dehydratase-2